MSKKRQIINTSILKCAELQEFYPLMHLDKKKLHEMISSIAHRGPDQKNIFKNKLGIFGFLRLKIIDLSNKSNQPLMSKDKNIQVIYNGEIYNYKTLKTKYFPRSIFFLMVTVK